MREEKILVVENMIANGYKMMGRTVDWFVDNFSLEELKSFEENFLKTIG